MLERASGQFIIDGQVEDILGGTNGAARIARISQSCQFSGQLEGESVAEFTAVLPRGSDGSFHGFQRVTGKLGEREGSFVLDVSGEYHRGQPRGSWKIVPKSGSGDLVHIRGSGTFSLPDGKPGKYSLEFDVRKPRAAKTPVQAEPPDELAVAQHVAEDRIEEVPAVVATSLTPKTPKTNRKPRKQTIETPVELVAEVAPKRTRARKSVPEVIPTVVIVEETPKRTRTRKSVEEAVPAATLVEPVPKPKRSRKTAPVNVEPASSPVSAQPETKPNRSRKAPVTEPPVEVVAAAVEPESSPAKPARRKKATPPEPIALPVTESAPARKRRAKAA